MAVIILIIFGRPDKGKSAPDKKNIGITRKFIIRWKPSISSKTEAIAVPKAVKNKDIRSIKRKASGKNISEWGRNPARSEIRKTIIP